jgi:hypothetical protein
VHKTADSFMKTVDCLAVLFYPGKISSIFNKEIEEKQFGLQFGLILLIAFLLNFAKKKIFKK